MMQEKSKALEDKLAQLTEKYSACWRDWNQEVEVNHRRMAEFVRTVSFFAKCSDAVCIMFLCVLTRRQCFWKPSTKRSRIFIRNTMSHPCRSRCKLKTN